MTFKEIISRVRVNTNDPTSSIFLDEDIRAYINEAIDRFANSVYFQDMSYLTEYDSSPELLPRQYHHLLAVYATARCFAQDERHYQATTFMNEFEIKLEEMLNKIESGEITILDNEGNEIDYSDVYEVDYVEDIYFNTGTSDDDTGVEGVQE